MTRHPIWSLFLFLAALAMAPSLHAQWSSHQSVLATHEWYKVGVTEDGVYAIDYATLQSLGIDVRQLDPSHIRMFGNVQRILPEANSQRRYDDLTEAAIQVTGAEDGSFDQGDRILFYGQGPVNMVHNTGSYFDYERNPYTDTVYYFLCVNGEVEGLRIGEQASVEIGKDDAVIEIYPDYYYHESDEFSPYASGRVWYGDLFTRQEGFKDFSVDVPGLLFHHGVRVDSKVLGRCKPASSYSVTLNNLIVAANQPIDYYRNREYGKEHAFSRTTYPQSEHLTLRYTIHPTEGNLMLFIDYFVLNFWRELRYRGPSMAFRFLPAQWTADPIRVRIADGSDEAVCWEVTNPLHPVRQLTEAQPTGCTFGMEGQRERRFHMFETDGLKPVASIRSIPNQNLHGLETAELLIVTHRRFWAQAQALADFHREYDNMDCIVADVAEVYNEFGTGAPDPTSLRDFIRMLYLRSEGRLQYVLLLGKGTHDFRGIKGIDNNFVVTFETENYEYSEVDSKCTDDYFALMDLDEGLSCNGRVDLGVGRIPITTPEQGDAVLAKIRRYADPDVSHGLWKNNHLLMADNDAIAYPNYAETLAATLDTAWHDATCKKLYLDSYPVVSTPAGERVPMANRVLMESFESGIGVMSYTGHGGVKSLSAEWVLSLADIQAMTNADRLPFVHTATCEFSKFDDPGVVSGGELMLMNPNGGAIALLTTVRPTVAQNNQKMSRSVHEHLYDMIDRQHLRFGDIYRIVKSDPGWYSKTNVVYYLFGDPALRLGYPSQGVATDRLTGEEVLTVTGHVTLPDGTLDSQFNGVVDLRLYDQRSKHTTLGQYDDPVTYSFFNDVLFEGRVSVAQGRFEARIPVPSTVSQTQGKARLVYSAYDSLRKVEACGVCDDYEIHAPATVIDNQGPDIQLYWNTPEFQSGDLGAPTGVLYADLFDEHGIYHYNVSIGRDIVLNSNIEALDNLILNDRYEPALDDYRKGRIAIPLSNLPDGIYEFSLKAWDTWNNATEASILLLVERSVLITELRNYPNPFSDEVYFSFLDGEQTEDLDVVLEVFDVMGRRVAMLQERTSSVSGVVPAIRWDGRGSGGAALPPGMYLYRLSVTGPDGRTKTVSHPMLKQ